MDSGTKKTYLSDKKYKELKEELVFLKNTKRGEVAKQIEEAKAFGDLSENAEYHQARGDKQAVEERILTIEVMLEDVEIVKHHHSSVIEVGSTVVVQKKGEKETRNFEIVGSEEADNAQGKISMDSPIGSAMLGKKKEDTFVFETPSGKKISYSIIEIK